MVYSLTVWTSWTCNICTNRWATLSIFALLCRGAFSLYSSVNSLNLELDNLANCCSLLCLPEPIFDNRRKKAAFSKLVFKFEEGILTDYIWKNTRPSFPQNLRYKRAACPWDFALLGTFTRDVWFDVFPLLNSKAMHAFFAVSLSLSLSLSGYLVQIIIRCILTELKIWSWPLLIWECRRPVFSVSTFVRVYEWLRENM